MMSELTKKAFVENTIGVCQTMHNAAEKEGRDLSVEEQATFDALIGAYNTTLGRNCPPSRSAFAEYCKGPESAYESQHQVIGNPMAGPGGTNLGPSVPGSVSTPDPIQFIDAKTGERVSTLQSGEKISDLSPGLHRGNDDPYAVGNYIKAIVTGDSSALNEAVGDFAAISGDDSRGGYPTTIALSNSILDLARSASVIDKAGAQTVPMSTGELGLVRTTKDPTAFWRAEAQNITASEVGYDLIKLRAKTVAAAITISVEMMEDAANAAQVIQNQLQMALGLALDKAGLDGAGAENEPRGIINSNGVNEVASVGTPTNYSSLSSAVGKIVQANYPGSIDSLAFIQHPRDEEIYDGLTDSTGQPLRPTPWAEKPKRLYTTSIPTTLGGGAESYGVLGDFSQMLIGMRTQGVRIAVLNSGTIVKNWTPDGESSAINETINAASSLQRIIVAYMRADVALLRPTWFTKLTGVTIS